MADLDWSKHDKEITDFVRRVTNYYLRTEASTGQLLQPDQGILLRNNYATPSRVRILLNYLATVSAQVNEKLEKIRIACVAAQINFDACKAGSTTFGPILNDYENWMQRLQGYQEQTQAAMARSPNASGDDDPIFWNQVTKPLLLGLFPGEDRQRKLDATTPLTMAWQIEVAEQAYEDARKQLWIDLKNAFSDAADDLTDFGSGLLVLGLAALAFGYGFGKGRR